MIRKSFGVILVSLLVLACVGVAETTGGRAFKPHPPIYIDGNTAFTAENGVVTGLGTVDNPYVIEGWAITAAQPAIMIRDTKSYALIRDCTVSASDDGIRIENASNITIQDCILVSNDDAVVVMHARRVQILRCQVTPDTGAGIGLHSSVDIKVSYNVVESGAVGIEVVDCSSSVMICKNTVKSNLWNGMSLRSSNNVIVRNNEILDNRDHGISIFGKSSKNVVSANVISGSMAGIKTFDQALENTFAENVIADCGIRGIELGKGATRNLVTRNHILRSNLGIHAWDQGNEIIGNTLERNERGIRLQKDARNMRICHNNFLYNMQNIDCEDPRSHLVDSSTEGNYWSDYSGWDANGDGISDSPYKIEGGGVDRYPLMRPWKPSVVAMGIKFTGSDEFVTIANWSGEDVNLTGWKLEAVNPETSDIQYTFVFPDGCILPIDGKLRVHSGSEPTPKQDASASASNRDLYGQWQDSEQGGCIWNDLGGMVRIVNYEEKVVDEYEYHWWMGQ